MKKFLQFLIFSALLAATAIQAATLAGVTVPDTIQLGGAKLVLNGVGLRTKFFFKIYVGALYLPHKADTPAAVLAEAGPDRLLMHMIYAVDRKEFADAWRDGFKDNNPHMNDALKTAMEKFISYFGDSKKGDEIILDYVPGQGTLVSWNGHLKGSITGVDFHEALLNVFLGPNPPTSRVKRGLLGQKD